MPRASLGEKIKARRKQVGVSQLRLATDAKVSPRHLSFIETGRSQPSRAMVLRLAEQLRVPLREQNAFLLAAGYAPAFEQHDLGAPQMRAVRDAAAQVLADHNPFPAVALDRGRNIVMSNDAAAFMQEGVDAAIVEPPVNIYRLLLHPAGLSTRIIDLPQYRAQLLARLHREVQASDDSELAALLTEVEGYGPTAEFDLNDPTHEHGVLVLRLRDGDRELALVSMLATFGTPMEVTASELVIESLFPADAYTAERLRTAARS